MRVVAALCSVPECEREKVSGDGLCGTHNMRKRRGHPLGAGLPALAQCSVEGCDRQRYSRDLCNPHFQRKKRGGDPGEAAPRRRPDGTGSIGDDGYVRLTRAGVTKPEHVWIMEALLGRDLLPAETVHHRNGQRADNRPENLELWSSSQPPGQRVEDKLAWARELLALYEPSAVSA